jgi:hypothetical protein
MSKKIPKVKRYVLIHRHQFGVSHAIFDAQGFNPQRLSEEQYTNLAKACGLDYEPNKEEGIEVLVADTDIRLITKADLKAPKDKNGRTLKSGQTVEVPSPSKPDDFWKHSFQGTVRSDVFNGLILVVDQEDNGWDVEPERLEII